MAKAEAATAAGVRRARASNPRRDVLFASISLAARIERADRQLMIDCAEAVARRRDDADVFVMPFAGGVATFADPDSPLNKVAGLGFAGPVDETELAQVERAYAARDTPVQVELSCLADPSVGELLTGRGYVLKGFENVLGQGLPTVNRPAAAEGIEIAVSGTEDLETWIDVITTGFFSPDGLRGLRIMQLTGWAADSQNWWSRRGDASLPYSDHADFKELVDYVTQVHPKRVYTVNGFPELAAHLREMGYPAVHLDRKGQPETAGFQMKML